MKFIDDLYEMYKQQLMGDEEDAIALVLHALQDHTKEDLVSFIDKMDEEEIYQMLGSFLIDQLKNKMSEEGLGHMKPKNTNQKNVH
jgi:hypothetical protein